MAGISPSGPACRSRRRGRHTDPEAYMVQLPGFRVAPHPAPQRMKGIIILVDRLYPGYVSGKRLAMKRSSAKAL
jgi:hypothetical protein